MHQDAIWYGRRPQPRRLCVRWGPRKLPKKKAEISGHVYCSQTAEWIKMALGMEVGLCPVNVVLDGDTAALTKKGTKPSPIFGPSLLWSNGWMHQDATRYGGRPQPSGLCVRWRPSPPPQKGGGPPKFSAHVYGGQMAGCIKMPLSTNRPQPRRLCVRWGPSLLHTK